MYIGGTAGAANGYLFSIPDIHDKEEYTTIVFWINGTVDGKSLSINLNGAAGPFYNLGAVGTETVEVLPSGQNSYAGSIDTEGEWTKIVLVLEEQPAEIAFKFGREGHYALFLDDMYFE